LPIWLIVLFSVISALSTIGGVVVTVVSRLSKGNFAEFKLEIMKIIEDKLDSFVKKSDLINYSESHSREHKHLDEEVTKLRSFKHDVSAEIRKTGAIVDDVKEDIKEVKGDIKDIRKDEK